MKKLLIIIVCFYVAVPARAGDRCTAYRSAAIEASMMYFGSFPWWYLLGQLRQESCCRADVTAFDGGMGIAQFMPKTAEEIYRMMQQRLNPYNTRDAIRMQAFYMSRLDRQAAAIPGNAERKLFLSFMAYNSGLGNVKKEAIRAGSTDHQEMRSVCRRKILTLKNGNKLDLCDVGYDYPVRIYKYGQRYRSGQDTRIFW